MGRKRKNLPEAVQTIFAGNEDENLYIKHTENKKSEIHKYTLLYKEKELVKLTLKDAGTDIVLDSGGFRTKPGVRNYMNNMLRGFGVDRILLFPESHSKRWMLWIDNTEPEPFQDGTEIRLRSRAIEVISKDGNKRKVPIEKLAVPQ